MTTSPLNLGGIIDNKLQHLIHKIIKSSTSSKATPFSSQILYSNQVFDTLLTKHREYKRKNSSTLQTQIDEILIAFAKNNRFKTRICSKTGSLIIQSIDTTTFTGVGGGSTSVVVPIGQQHVGLNRPDIRKDNSKHSTTNHTNDNSDQIVINKAVGNKRKRNLESQLNPQNQQQNNNYNSSDEEEYDKAATQNDLIAQSQQDSGSSSMLNANLRNRYKDVQRERDIIARKKAKATAEEEKLAKNANDAENSNEHNNSSEKKSYDTESNNNNIEIKCSALPSIPEISSDQSINNDTETINNPTSSAPSTPLTITQNINTPLKKKKKRINKSSSSNSLSKLDNISSEQSSSIFVSPTPRPKERYSDLGGITDTMTQIRQLIEYPLSHPELFAHLGIHPPRGKSLTFLIIMFEDITLNIEYCVQVFY
jgi:hypothetical protein